MTELPELDATEQRVLGSLLEKQSTVPSSYPLSANALRTACNQTSSRDPVLDLDEQTVEQTARRLKERGLLRIVWADTGRRTLKYHQILDQVLELQPDERAVMTVLMLRGPQAPGELRTRTERLFAFEDRTAVEGCLHRMAERPVPLVRELERRPGQQDRRWAHLLGPLPEDPSPRGAPSVDRDAVISAGADARDARVRASYDSVAATYADNLVDELARLPLETWLLDRVVDHAVHGGAPGPVIEVGCGPGHVTDYLASRGADASGIDLSPGMVAEARRRYPERSYDVGDLRRLTRPPANAGWAAVLAWYSLVHLAASELPEAIAAMARPLAARGWLVLGLHTGDEVRHFDEWFDEPVDLDFVLQDPAAVVSAVKGAGLVEVEWYLRGAIESRNETTQRLYVVARKPEQ